MPVEVVDERVGGRPVEGARDVWAGDGVRQLPADRLHGRTELAGCGQAG